MAPKTPPQAPPVFRISADSIVSETKTLLDRSNGLRDGIVCCVSTNDATFATVVRPLVDDFNRVAGRLNILGTLLAEASPDLRTRNAAREAQKLILLNRTAQLMSVEIADRISVVHQRADANTQLGAQDRHLLDHMHGEIQRSGLLLGDEAIRKRLRDIHSEIDELQMAAVKTLTDGDNGGLWFSGQELQGMSTKVLDSLETRTEVTEHGISIVQYFVTFKNSVASQISSSVCSGDSRRRYTVATRRRYPENSIRLARLVVLRDEMARILGFENYASMRMEEMMADSVSGVLVTLHAMIEKLKPLADAENDKLLELKRQESSDYNKDGKVVLNDWDRSFYLRQFKAQNQVQGSVSVEEYFEVHHTWNRTLDLFEKLFQIEFHEITRNTSTWHDSVKAFSVWDGRPGGDSSFLGYLYADLFEREGKYQNQRQVLIEPSFVTADGTRNYLSSAMLCNFRAPSSTEPSLLDLFDVRTLFHELGHCIHNIVSMTKYAIPHSRDYIEVPSVLLEKWGWEPEILAAIARNHRHEASQNDANTKIPNDVLSSIEINRGLFGANNMLPVLQRAIFDLVIHSPKTRQEALDMDVTNIWNTTRRDIANQSCNPEDWGWEEAAFGHLFRKYSAGFFAYATAKAYASDLYSSHFAQDPLDPARVEAWRRRVPQLGSSLPEAAILQGFMERELNVEILMSEISQSSLGGKAGNVASQGG